MPVSFHAGTNLIMLSSRVERLGPFYSIACCRHFRFFLCILGVLPKSLAINIFHRTKPLSKGMNPRHEPVRQGHKPSDLLQLVNTERSFLIVSIRTCSSPTGEFHSRGRCPERVRRRPAGDGRPPRHLPWRGRWKRVYWEVIRPADEQTHVAAGTGRGGKGTMIHGIYQMTPRQFRKAIDAGVFGENHVELLGGIPFIMSENPPHILASAECLRCAVRPWPPRPRWFVNKEHRLALGRWRPLADVVVLRGPETTYGTRLARADDVALLVEVSDTTYAKDSGPKLRRYATFRIPVYWIVDLNRRIVEVRTGRSARGSRPVMRGATSIARATRSPWSSTARRSGGSRCPTCCPEPARGESGAAGPRLSCDPRVSDPAFWAFEAAGVRL